MLAVFLGGVFLPAIASALEVPTSEPKSVVDNSPFGPLPQGTVRNITVCPGNDPANPEEGLTSRLIPCIRDNIIYTTTQLIVPLNNYFNDAVTAATVLALALWGIMVMAGHSTNISREGIILGIKIAAIMMFTNNFNNMYPTLLNSVEGLLNVLAVPALPLLSDNSAWNGSSSFTCKFGTFQDSERNIMEIWNILDCYIDLLIGGIFSEFTMASGIIGLIAAAVFSTTAGLFVALAGLFMIAYAFMTISKLVYIFITSYIAFSFMVLISCIFIPCILFRSTKEYFDGWLRLTLSFLLQPLFVFTYLVMFLVAINVTVFSGPRSLYYTIAAGDAIPVDGGAFHIGDWMQLIGAYKEELKAKDQIRVGSAGETLNEENPVDTMHTDKQGYNPLAFKNLSDFMTWDPTTPGKPLAFFQSGIPVTTVDWEVMARTAQAEEWSNAQIRAAGAANEIEANKILDQFYLDYKISVFIAFFMAAVTMYLFYSLLEFIPYIGTGALGDSGISPTLGAGSLAPPGSSMLGGR